MNTLMQTRSFPRLALLATLASIVGAHSVAAQATKIPGVDLDALSPAAKAGVLQKLNADTCTCGCALTLAACRINDTTCTISLPIAQRIAREAAVSR